MSGTWSQDVSHSFEGFRHRKRLSTATDNLSAVSTADEGSDVVTTGNALRLSQFPVPPSETLRSAVHDDSQRVESGPSARAQGKRPMHRPPDINVAPLQPKRRMFHQVRGEVELSARNSSQPQSMESTSTSTFPRSFLHRLTFDGAEREAGPSSPSPLSPYEDWLEGRSSIALHSNEESLFSASFFTSLLTPATDQPDAEAVSSSSPALRQSDTVTIESPAVQSSSMSPDRDREGSPPTHHSRDLSTFKGDRNGEASPSPSDAQLRDSTVSGRSSGFDLPRDRRQNAAESSIAPSDQWSSEVGGTRLVLLPSYSKAKSSYSAYGRKLLDDGDNDSRFLDSTIDDKSLLPAYADSSAMFEPSTISSAVPILRNPDPTRIQHATRHSVHSTKTTKSTKSYVSSFLGLFQPGPSNRSRSRTTSWFRPLKPLPPVPLIPDIPISAERQHRMDDAVIPLPHLLNRNNALALMLEDGNHPHVSYIDPTTSSNGNPKSAEGAPGGNLTTVIRLVPQRRADSGDFNFTQSPWELTDNTKSRRMSLHDLLSSRPRRFGLIAAIAVVIVVLAISLGVGLGVKHHTSACPANFVGAACNLNATCVCSGGSSNDCLAQNLVDLIPDVNMLFNVDFTQQTLFASAWDAEIIPENDDTNCSSQATLVDVAPALNPADSPNRTTWAQSAILWNFAESQNSSAATAMKNFIALAPWSSIDSADGPVADPSSDFALFNSGFVFDFAAQTVVPANVTYEDDVDPSTSQSSQMNGLALTALNRMYAYAAASSIQHQTALSNFWVNTLSMDEDDLDTFMNSIRSSPIMLSFDATSSPGSQPLVNLLTSSTTDPFPPPLACYPGLSSSQVQRVSTIETTVFGLPDVESTSQFNQSCFPNHPVYGVLDVFRLRSPFYDWQSGIANQSAVLNSDAALRAVVYSGQVLSGLPGIDDSDDLTASQIDPRQYGTLNYLDHVVLNYLTSITTTQAQAVASYIAGSPGIPPNDTNAVLYGDLPTLPLIEVAVFGSITPSDISYSTSTFMESSTDFFFGTSDGSSFREWAIAGVESYVAWTPNSTSSVIVRDSSFTNAPFNATWEAVAAYISTMPTGEYVGLVNITTSFADNNMFSAN